MYFPEEKDNVLVLGILVNIKNIFEFELNLHVGWQKLSKVETLFLIIIKYEYTEGPSVCKTSKL